MPAVALDYIYKEDQRQNKEPDILNCVCDSIILVEFFFGAVFC